MNEATFVQALNKLRRQIAALQEARMLVAELLPLDEQAFDPAELTPEERMFLDACRARLADLQDFLGQRVFRLVALWDEDESPAHPLSTRERAADGAKRVSGTAPVACSSGLTQCFCP